MNRFTKIWKAKSKEIKKEDILEKLDRQCPECGGDLLVKFGRYRKIHRLQEISRLQIYGKNAEEKKIEAGKQRRSLRKMRRADGRETGTIRRVSRLLKISGLQKHQKNNVGQNTGVKCPKCRGRRDFERRSRKGRLFYGCSQISRLRFFALEPPDRERIAKNAGA